MMNKRKELLRIIRKLDDDQIEVLYDKIIDEVIKEKVDNKVVDKKLIFRLDECPHCFEKDPDVIKQAITKGGKYLLQCTHCERWFSYQSS